MRRTSVSAAGLTLSALVTVCCSQRLQQGNDFGHWRDPRYRAIRHVCNRLVAGADNCDVRAFRDEIHDHLLVSARRSMVQRGHSQGIAGVHVLMKFFDDELQGRHPGVGSVDVRIAGKTFAVSFTSHVMDRQDWTGWNSDCSSRGQGEAIGSARNRTAAYGPSAAAALRAAAAAAGAPPPPRPPAAATLTIPSLKLAPRPT